VTPRRRIILGPQAERDLRKMPSKDEDAVRRAMRAFAAGEMPNADIRKLEDQPGFRLRVGSWRVLFRSHPRRDDGEARSSPYRADVSVTL
jgi:mRNA interferase RelE/StbE